MHERSVIKVHTKYGAVDDVPDTDWVELRPYWPDIVASIIEVLHEGDFDLSEVRKDNPYGFIASTPYWRLHKKKQRKYPLKEAKKFISCLKKKRKFVSAISSFNRGHNTNWLLEEKVPILGGYLCSLCSPVLEYLRSVSI